MGAGKGGSMRYQGIYTRTYIIKEEIEADSRAEAEMLAEIGYSELTWVDLDDADSKGKWEITEEVKGVSNQMADKDRLE
jgi:hypothetical protein